MIRKFYGEPKAKHGGFVYEPNRDFTIIYIRLHETTTDVALDVEHILDILRDNGYIIQDTPRDEK